VRHPFFPSSFRSPSLVSDLCALGLPTITWSIVPAFFFFLPVFVVAFPFKQLCCHPLIPSLLSTSPPSEAQIAFPPRRIYVFQEQNFVAFFRAFVEFSLTDKSWSNGIFLVFRRVWSRYCFRFFVYRPPPPSPPPPPPRGVGLPAATTVLFSRELTFSGLCVRVPPLASVPSASCPRPPASPFVFLMRTRDCSSPYDLSGASSLVYCHIATDHTPQCHEG